MARSPFSGMMFRMDAQQPGGAMVAVYSHSPDGIRYLLLHNSDYAPGEAGDWAWGTPSGCREEGEDISACAARELYEESGIRGEPEPVEIENVNWAVFTLQVPWGTRVELSTEHNDFAWVTVEDTRTMCRPEGLAISIRTAVQAVDDSTTRSS